MTKQNKTKKQNTQNKKQEYKAQGVMDYLQESIYANIYTKTKNARLAFRDWAGACLYAMSQEEDYKNGLEKIRAILKKSIEDNGEDWNLVKGAENKKIRYLKKLYECRTDAIDNAESPEAIADYINAEKLSFASVDEEHADAFQNQKEEKPAQDKNALELKKLVDAMKKLADSPVMLKAFNDLMKKEAGFYLVKDKQARIDALKVA